MYCAVCCCILIGREGGEYQAGMETLYEIGFCFVSPQLSFYIVILFIYYLAYHQASTFFFDMFCSTIYFASIAVCLYLILFGQCVVWWATWHLSM